MPVILKNKHLKVTIGYPMELYRGSRFDHSGNILQVTLNNKHTFCTSEKSEILPDYGFGLMNEFDIDSPQGYAETTVGSYFYKIGVGNLRRETDEPYQFFRQYPMNQYSFSILKETPEEIVFQTKHLALQNSGILYQKSISIHRNELLLSYRLMNKSNSVLKTNEYCHNFVAFNHSKINSQYSLKFNFNLNNRQFEEANNIEFHLSIIGDQINWTKIPDNDIFIRRLNGNDQSGKWWELHNKLQGLTMKEEVSFEAELVNLWGNAHVVSPELFCVLEIEPEEEKTWWRKFTFSERSS